MQNDAQANLEPEVTGIDLDEIEAARRRVVEEMRHSGHSWRQMGTTIHCDSCKNGHGFSVLPGVMLQGIDEHGRPILEKVF